ncbi:hypothetical protein A8950_1646 [Dongia mobilis]|uniref:GDSL-like lipase/acylhydrolase family protein n=1 Tax=Dongia mobilis TaxID=578943 RepID=A0A4V3DEW1_9PROT|nr:SGNH/GDSL hydrolase family protein [Dongia mobilis]TDQ83360.1 hypothetical protein A8950_1646 [Dongia mobilis]
MMRSALRTTIIGGSNTVMQPGYLGQLVTMSAQRGVPLEIVADLAIGGTTSAFGLYQLKTSAALEQSDLLLIEYVINDAFIYGDERRQFRHWARLYEGIIRHALARNPKLRICTLIFGARNGSWLSSVPAIDAGIHYISDYYGTDCIDLSRALMRRFGREVVSDAGFYADQGHYARPVVTGLVADLAAEAIQRLAAGRWQEMPTAGLPPAIDPDHFAAAEVIDAATLFAAARDAGMAAYHNRRFSLDAVDLAEHEVSLTLEGGLLLGIFHVSEPQTAPLALYRNEMGYACSLLKGGVRDGKFKFLAAMLPCEFLYGADLLKPLGVETIRLGRAMAGDALKPHIAKDNVAQDAAAESSQRLPLMGILHSGKRLDLAIRRRDTGAALAAE